LDGKQLLSEVEKWDLEDVAKMNALLDMRSDYQTAMTQFHQPEDK
jgi:hypothetical protein